MTFRSEHVSPLPERLTFREGFATRKEWLDTPDDAVIGNLVRSPAKTVVAALTK